MRYRSILREGAARARATVACALVAAASCTAAQPSVVKCVDPDGNVTYQDSPCTGGQSGRSVELPKAETREDTGAWEAAAKEARVIPGMPKRWVLRARGAPAEIRPGGAREEASEVWRYPARDGAVLVGFAGPNVAWIRDEPAGRAAAPAAMPAGTAGRGAENRRFVIAGRYCEHVFAEIGPADREEALPAPAGGATDKRYYYEPQAGDPSMRTSFSCVGGKVADVERVLVR